MIKWFGVEWTYTKIAMHHAFYLSWKYSCRRLFFVKNIYVCVNLRSYKMKKIPSLIDFHSLYQLTLVAPGGYVSPLSVFWLEYFSRWSYELEILWLFIKFYMKHGIKKMVLVSQVIYQHWLVCQWPSPPKVYHWYIDSLLHRLIFRSCMQFFLYFYKLGSYCVHY